MVSEEQQATRTIKFVITNIYGLKLQATHPDLARESFPSYIKQAVRAKHVSVPLCDAGDADDALRHFLQHLRVKEPAVSTGTLIIAGEVTLCHMSFCYVYSERCLFLCKHCDARSPILSSRGLIKESQVWSSHYGHQNLLISYSHIDVISSMI
jgi:hypothetical protein